ncbi:MAG: hypothetical protein NXI31_07350 [bacterium]|nr:hypothetical protein [bacterium]
MMRVNLESGDRAAFSALAAAFAANNAGHELHWYRATSDLTATDRPRILLVQAGEARATIDRRDSAVGLGDVLVLAPGQTAAFDAAVGLLEFTLPADPKPPIAGTPSNVPDAGVPRVIRPDWDPAITDTPGGCATDEGAYRRVLLTWLGKNGPYTFHGLNVHRVRIDDSFTHYHPTVGGFDEFYLVQAVRPGARLITSERVAAIEQPESLDRAEIDGLLESTELAMADLVYLPRGTAHRGLGGVLAQVITVPGFVPGAEIGIDHHLHSINQRFGLSGAAALPLHAAGAETAIVR